MAIEDFHSTDIEPARGSVTGGFFSGGRVEERQVLVLCYGEKKSCRIIQENVLNVQFHPSYVRLAAGWIGGAQPSDSSGRSATLNRRLRSADQRRESPPSELYLLLTFTADQTDSYL